MAYALIKNGVVEHLVSVPEGGRLEDLNFLKSDQIASAVEIPADIKHPRVGWRFIHGKFIDPNKEVVLSLSQKAKLILDGGLFVTSKGTPAINGVYSATVGTSFGLYDIITEMQYILAIKQFSSGLPSLEWLLRDGKTWITFSSTKDFLNVAKEMIKFVSACRLVIMKNEGDVPSAEITIL